MKATEHLTKAEWASVMSQLIFGLLHTEDTLTLRVAGIMIDPFHAASPLSFRMGFMLKHILISQEDPQLSRGLIQHLLKSCEVNRPQANDRECEDALIQLLYCERSQAKNLLSGSVKPIKISLKKSLESLPATITRAPPQPQIAASGSRRGPRRVIYKDDNDYDDDGEEEVINQVRTTRRGRPVGRPSTIKTEADDDEYNPKKVYKSQAVAPKSAPKATRGRVGKPPLLTTPIVPKIAAVPLASPNKHARGIRGPYKKSEQQKKKEVAKVHKYLLLIFNKFQIRLFSVFSLYIHLNF